MDSKVCTDCGAQKPLDQFYANRRASDGLLSRCKPCHDGRIRAFAARRTEERRIERERVAAERIAAGAKPCSRCGNTQPFGEFYTSRQTRDGYRTVCKTCIRGQAAQRRPKLPKSTTQERFDQRVSYGGPGECWQWIGSASRSFWWDGDTRDARHYALMTAGVEIDPRMKVVGTCDNDRCVNPGHMIQKPRGNGLRHDTKRCSDCGKEKPLAEFSPCKTGARGRYNWCKPCARDRKRKQVADGALPRKMRYARLGLTVDEVEAMREIQGGVCAICGSLGGVHGLCLDHSHETGLPRELICPNCNSGIGMFRDDPDWMLKAVAYLRKWNAITGVTAASAGAAI